MGKDKAQKKRLKAQIKLAKARHENPAPAASEKSSPALHFAEAVRGILYLLASVSLVFAVLLQERGVFLPLNEIVEDLLVLQTGRVLLIVIAAALFIYGLKHIRLLK